MSLFTNNYIHIIMYHVWTIIDGDSWNVLRILNIAIIYGLLFHSYFKKSLFSFRRNWKKEKEKYLARLINFFSVNICLTRQFHKGVLILLVPFFMFVLFSKVDTWHLFIMRKAYPYRLYIIRLFLLYFVVLTFFFFLYILSFDVKRNANNLGRNYGMKRKLIKKKG
jgi:hypothetical protein